MLIEPPVFSDDRGFFLETYKRSAFVKAGIVENFVQISHSKSSRRVLRGLHYQKYPHAQAKLVRVLVGEIYDVVVDLRRGAPTYGRWLAEVISAEEKKMIYVPEGFAHGFCVLSDEAEVLYTTSSEYAPKLESGIIWNDPDLRIEWPINQPVLSERDSRWPCLRNADNNF
jgi:dTDP-4-dehydrorhamnose 3,5-epimerase